MKAVLSTRDIVIPKGVKVTLGAKTVTVTGPRGTLTRKFANNSFAATLVGKKLLRVDMWFGNRLEIACLRTITTHIENMIIGVTKGFQYKIRAAFNHFPVNIAITNEGSDNFVEIRNFLGERRVRKIKMLEGCVAKKSDNNKDEIIIEGNSVEKVSGSAALIHEACLVKRKDIRKFLDGFYVSEKGPIGETVSLM